MCAIKWIPNIYYKEATNNVAHIGQLLDSTLQVNVYGLPVVTIVIMEQ